MRLIDADALRKTMYHEAFVEDSGMQKWDAGCWIRYKLFENAIEAAPTISPKHGRWVRHILKNANVPWGFDCSECGEWFVIGEDTAERYYYCPNCGARMEEVTE